VKLYNSESSNGGDLEAPRLKSQDSEGMGSTESPL